MPNLDTSTPVLQNMPVDYQLTQQSSLIALFQLYLVMGYTLLDFAYFYWVCHWFFKLPKPLNINVPAALVGLGTRLRAGFGVDPVLTKAQGQSRSEGFSFNKTPKTK